MLKAGDKAPSFSLADQEGITRHWSELKGKTYTVIFFYPKDHSPGCTAQACSFRDNYGELKKMGAQIIGISADSVESHKKFGQKQSLSFPLLSDVNNDVRKLFGVKKTLGLLPGRATFIVDAEDKIQFAFSSQIDIQKHVDDAIAYLRSQKL